MSCIVHIQHRSKLAGLCGGEKVCLLEQRRRHDNKLYWHDPAVVDAHPFKSTESIVSAASALNCAKRHYARGRGPVIVYWRISSFHLSTIPWPESASELYRPDDCRLSTKLVPTFADRGCRVVSARIPTAVFSDLYTGADTISSK
jgi:hypothetical protein